MQIKPYTDIALSKIYNMLYADDPQLFSENISGHPSAILTTKDPDMVAVEEIANNPSADSRARLIACSILRSAGRPVNSKEILGIIVEVGLDDGLDVLAAYKDGTARYINHAEKIIIWETTTAESQALIAELFTSGLQVVKNIGPWDKARLPQPAAGSVRLNFLVADGLYFGQGPFELLQGDRLGGPVIQAAMRLMSFLIGQHHPHITAN